MAAPLDFFHFDKKKDDDYRYSNVSNVSWSLWRKTTIDPPRRSYGVVGSYDDGRGHKSPFQFAWWKVLVFVLLIIVCGCCILMFHEKASQWSSLMGGIFSEWGSGRLFVTLYLNNGCKGEQVRVLGSTGQTTNNPKGLRVKSVSFCDLRFTHENVKMPVNDQVRSVRVERGRKVDLYEHCSGPSGDSQAHQGVHEPLITLHGGWLGSACHDLTGRATQASFLDTHI